MKTDWLIVDGYSLVHHDPATARHLRTRLHVARQQVVRYLEEFGSELAPRITVVFDGRHHEPGEDVHSDLVEILYAPVHLTADSVIERLVDRCAKPGGILVVTSDYAERNTVAAAGAESMSCEQFLEQRERRQDTRIHRRQGQRGRTSGPSLGDFFPDDL